MRPKTLQWAPLCRSQHAVVSFPIVGYLEAIVGKSIGLDGVYLTWYMRGTVVPVVTVAVDSIDDGKRMAQEQFDAMVMSLVTLKGDDRADTGTT